ncbi:MAG: fluoride efflux transporter CrcB [Nitrospinae bacterium]|nr:fluoride efflux transporter CrcB [Nitrospinota bacterium]
MTKIMLLVAGGATGTVTRYAVSGLTHRYFDGTFPIGTLVVNLIGSFLIGLIWGLWETSNISSNTRTFIFIGILGGFTTFSSYTMETVNLFRDGEIKLGLTNILANNIIGLLLVFIGFILGKGLINLTK